MKEHGAIVQHCQAAGSLFRSVQDRFTGQQNVRRSLSVYITGRVSVGQVINSTFALRAVNFSAINSDEPRKRIAESCKKLAERRAAALRPFTHCFVCGTFGSRKKKVLAGHSQGFRSILPPKSRDIEFHLLVEEVETLPRPVSHLF